MKKNILFTFDFEEVNSAVLRNAQIYCAKKNNSIEYYCISPENFAFLFKNCNGVFKISNTNLDSFSIKNYISVLEYRENKLIIYFNLYFNKTLFLISPLLYFLGVKLNIVSNFYRSDRQRKFFIGSGLERFCLNNLNIDRDKFIYFRGNDFLDFYESSFKHLTLNDHFIKQFKYLYTMISESSLYDPLIEIKQLEIKFPKIIKFLSSKNTKIVLRTRNFKNKATTHNTKKDLVLPIILNLFEIDPNILILNIGNPLLRLDISNDRYFELEGNLDIEDEISLCKLSNAAMMTSEAGLFTAFAASNIRIIQIDEEWSMYSISEKVSLFEARSCAGLLDIDIRSLKSEPRKASMHILDNL